jgi:FtsH-binding integral membrane protein
MLPARGVLETQTMKLWHKILWITTAIVPFAVIALAWQYAESSFFLLLQCSIWWIMLWSAAAFIMQFVVICRKHSRKKAIQWLIAVVALYGLLLLIAGIILYFCGVIKL